MAKPSDIKNIIFDLGGVLLNIDPSITGKELKEMGVQNLPQVLEKLASSRIYERLDTGALSDPGFRDEVRKACDMNLSDEQVDEAWNALLLDFPAPRVQMLKELNENYRIFLLSNTNSIHFISYTKTFREVHGFEMKSLFEQLFLSFEMGVHKPDAEIYNMSLEKGGLKASETLFIDDSLANAEAAVACGLAALHLKSGMEITDQVKNGKLRDDAEFLVILK